MAKRAKKINFSETVTIIYAAHLMHEATQCTLHKLKQAAHS